MEAEGLIDKETAVMRIEPAQIDQLLHPMFDADELSKAEKLTRVFLHHRALQQERYTSTHRTLKLQLQAEKR